MQKIFTAREKRYTAVLKVVLRYLNKMKSNKINSTNNDSELDNVIGCVKEVL